MLSLYFIYYDICWIVVIIVELVCFPNITIRHFFFAYSHLCVSNTFTSNFNDSIENLKYKCMLQCHIKIKPTADNAIPAVFCMFSFYLYVNKLQSPYKHDNDIKLLTVERWGSSNLKTQWNHTLRCCWTVFVADWNADFSGKNLTQMIRIAN